MSDLGFKFIKSLLGIETIKPLFIYSNSFGFKFIKSLLGIETLAIASIAGIIYGVSNS